MRVLRTVKKDILKTVIIDNKMDLVSHPYYSVLDIKKFHFLTRNVLRRIKVINLYDIKSSRDQVWKRSSARLQKASQDISWWQIIKGRVLIVGDVNVHNFMWNLHHWQNVNSRSLEELVKSYELIVNNNTNFSICLLSQRISIIDLALTSPGLDPLKVWEILEEYLSLSNYELILMEWKDINISGQGNTQAAMIG